MQYLVVLLSIFLSFLNLSHAVLIDKIIGIVNNEVILLSDINKFETSLSLRKELDPIFSFNPNMESGKPSREQILDFLVQDKLVSIAFKISDADVEQEIQSVQRNNRLSREDLITFLKSKGFTFDEYFEVMRSGLQKRALLDREIRNRVNITDDDVKNQYYNNESKGTTGSTLEYHLLMIALDYKTYKSPQDAVRYAEEITKNINQGESFIDLAKRVSDDPTSEQGGDLGYLSSDALTEPLRSAVKKLQISQISPPLKTPKGIVLLKLVDIRSTDNTALNEVREQIRERLAKEEYKKQLMLWAERAKNNAYIVTNPLN